MQNQQLNSRMASHLLAIVTCSILLLNVGCAQIFGPESTAVPTATPTRAYAAVPTYTPTVAVVAPTPTMVLATAAPTAIAITTSTGTLLVATPVTRPLTMTAGLTATASLTAPLSTPTTVAVATSAPTTPQLTISADVANVRSGPATSFDLVASVLKGEQFTVNARTQAGEWWQICCINGQSGWVYGELVTVELAEAVAVATDLPTVAEPTAQPIAVAPTATLAPAAPTAAPPPPSNDASAGDFNPDAQYQIVHFKVLGLNENNGGIRDSRAQHHIFLTVLDQNGNGLDGVVVENLVGEKGQLVTGSKGPGKAEVTMYYEPFKLRVVSDPGGPVSSQTSNQMGLAFPHLPDIVGKLGGLDYEYAVCPTIDVKCSWPIQAVHFSYEITFQRVR